MNRALSVPTGAAGPARASEPRLGYVHRSSQRTGNRLEVDRRKLKGALVLNRDALSKMSGRIKALTIQRDQEIARAIWGGMSISTVASAVSESIPKVQSTGLAFEEVPPSGLTADAHIAILQARGRQLKNAVAEREEAERRREQLVTLADRLQILDLKQLATLTGLSPEDTAKICRRSPSR